MASEEDIDNFLAHYGVPGMKWGKRAAAEVTAKVEKVKALNTSENRAKISKTSTKIGYAAVSAMLLGPVAKQALGSAALKVAAARGAKFAAGVLADSRGLTSYSTVALNLVGGVYR